MNQRRTEKIKTVTLSIKHGANAISGIVILGAIILIRTTEPGYYWYFIRWSVCIVDNNKFFSLFAEGVNHVLVNGVPVLLNGKHTNKYSGRFVKGPGFKSN